MSDVPTASEGKASPSAAGGVGVFLLGITFATTFLDQLTKCVVRSRFSLHESVSIIPGLFNLTYVKNTGAAFGMLSNRSPWLVILSVVMLAVIIVFRRAFLTDGRASRYAMALMISGIIGNLIDRLRLTFVVDFLDFYWGRHHFPAFNVADTAICTGVGLYILSQFLASREDCAEGTKSAERASAP